MYVKLTGGWLLEMKLGQLERVHGLGQVEGHGNGQVDSVVILGLVDCVLKGGEPFDVKLTMY